MRPRIKKFQALSDFETNFLQRVRLQIKVFTTRQILKQIFHNMSDFVLNLKKIFEQKSALKNHVLVEFTP